MGFLKGQTHVHTARSYDAKTPPNEVLAFYKSRGYDFVALTDHNRVTVVEPPEGLLLIPGVELSQNSTACDPAPTPGYRCLFHTSGLFLDPAKDARRGERLPLPFRPGRLAAYEEQLDLVASLGGIPVINHPLFHFALDGRAIRSLAAGRGVHLVELWNGSLDRQHPGGRADAEARAEQLWDEILSAGTLVYALATDDSHHFSDAADRARRGKFAYIGDQAFVMVRAERDGASIQRALLAGDFYASTGVFLTAVRVSRESIELEVEGGAAHTVRFVGKGGRELARVEGARARYEPRGDEGYVRAVVEDAAGHKAWLQPVTLSD